MIDLHVHTTASDGTMSPRELVFYAKEKGLSAVAITDHDTISGINEAVKAGEECGIEVVPGVEISVDYSQEMHILGYFINDSKALSDKLFDIRERRNNRNIKVVNKLNELGFKITMDEVLGKAKGESVGRVHIALVLIEKGYAKDVQSVFAQYLAVGSPAYFKREKLLPKEGIELILQAGGIPVLAHPVFFKENDLITAVSMLKQFGLAGMEAYYSMNSIEETERLLAIAKKFNLLVTGGTDFHGRNKPEIEIGVGKGNMKVEYDILQKMKKMSKKD